MYVDGSSKKEGMVLDYYSLNQIEMTIGISLCSNFKAANNEAEFEALLAVFRLGKKK